MITSFAIFRNDKATGNQPQYRMVGKDDNAPKEEKSKDIASLWLKEYNGNKYYSGKMKDDFKKDTGEVVDGYVIIPLKEYKELKGEAVEPDNTYPDDDTSIPF